jgi:hypothetical protein
MKERRFEKITFWIRGFMHIDAKTGIRRIVGCKNKDQRQKIGIQMIKHNEK